MFNKRVKIFVCLITVFLFLSLLRLAQMQILDNSFYREKIAELKHQSWRYKQLKTIRGMLLDRKQRPLAADSPQFNLNISYQLASFLDDRVIKSKLSAAEQKNDPALIKKINEQIKSKQQQLKNIIDKCTQFTTLTSSQIQNEINQINDYIWNQRTFQTLNLEKNITA